MKRASSVTQSGKAGSESVTSSPSIAVLWALLIVLIASLVVAIQVSRGGSASDSVSSPDSQVPNTQVEQLMSEAIRLIDQLRYTEGIALLEAAARVDARNPLVFFNMGVAHQFNGDLEKAEAAYSEALSLDNRFEMAYYNRGLARRDRGDLTGARDDLRIAVALNPENASAHFNLGQVLIALGEAEAGAESLATANSLNPSLGE